MSEPLDVIAARIARLALGQSPGFGRIGPGPVVTVVRDAASGKIYVGLNTGVPETVSDVLYKRILEHKAEIWQGEVVVVRTDPEAAAGGHSEINALNPAIRDREKVLGRKLTEKDLNVFELHNLWLQGKRLLTPAPRCEHCARLTRGVKVTESVFVAEFVAHGGVTGQTNAPQRGSVIAAGGGGSKPVTTTTGEIDPWRGSVTPAGGRASRPANTTTGEIDVLERGSITPAGSRVSAGATTASGEIDSGDGGGGGAGGAMGEGLLTAAIVIAEPLIKQWFAKNYLQEKWSAEQRAQVMNAIASSSYLYNLLIASRIQDIRREKAAGRLVKLRLDVDTDWIDTSYGPAQIKAAVSYYTLLFEGDTMIEWPLFQRDYGLWGAITHAAKITNRRSTYYIAL